MVKYFSANLLGDLEYSQKSQGSEYWKTEGAGFRFEMRPNNFKNTSTYYKAVKSEV